jgi:maltoporin
MYNGYYRSGMFYATKFSEARLVRWQVTMLILSRLGLDVDEEEEVYYHIQICILVIIQVNH